MNKRSFWYRTFDLYYDGFRSMTLGKKLWLVIFIKLFIMFAILRAFFFPNVVKQEAERQHVSRSEVVEEELIQRRAPHPVDTPSIGAQDGDNKQ